MGIVHKMLILTGRRARKWMGMYTRRVGRNRRNARYEDERGSNIFGNGVFMISAPPAITELAPDWIIVEMRKKRNETGGEVGEALPAKVLDLAGAESRYQVLGDLSA